MEIITDDTKCKELGSVKDNLTTIKLEKKTCKILKGLVKNKELSQENFEVIRPVGSIRPLLYGLPKLHKKYVPLKPISSMIRSPQHELARFLNNLLQPALQHFFQIHC